MFRILLAGLFFIMIVSFGCKQIPYKAQPPNTPASYLPQTYGSTWQYRDSLYGLPTDTFPLKGVKIDIISYTMNGLTTDFNGLICYNQQVTSQLFGSETAYSFHYSQKVGIIDSTPPWGYTNMQIYQDSAKVGFQWIYKPIIYSALNGFPVQAINTVVEKGITRVVNGQSYTNVIHTSSNFMINKNNNGFQNIALFDFYLAPGVGLIEKDVQYYNLINETETLMSYSIKQ